MNESSPFQVADPLFLNHFVRERPGGRSARQPVICFSGTHFSSITSFASGLEGEATRQRVIYFPGTHFSSITSFASGLGGEAARQPVIIFFRTHFSSITSFASQNGRRNAPKEILKFWQHCKMDVAAIPHRPLAS